MNEKSKNDNKSKIYFPGDEICENTGYIRGHGTNLRKGKIVSCYYGTLNQINKLITVKPNHFVRHKCEIGDIIIGRVKEIYNRKWKIEGNCSNDTTIALGAVNLPGVTQRRRIEADEMEMRNIFTINDLVVSEVQKVAKNGNTSLHTRSDKYGKLTNGLLITIPIEKFKSSEIKFVNTEKISTIIGNNGFIWISGDIDTIIEVRNIITNKLNKINELINVYEIIQSIK
ncbi:EXOS2 [Hepatospora eriocheir]|uniref:EXOS2 n=1 Tax=Hepatospora eriocheir TaxID=1081669 RepID=A0A1X0QAW0_9MICR|nr:EXOS2 [Hepatospora eriocheir]